MIQYLLFVTSKLLNVSDVTKRIGSFFKLPIQLFMVFLIPNSRYQAIDLYADGFSPIMTRDTLADDRSGHTDDPLVKRYIKMLQRTDRAIYIFPIWWGMMLNHAKRLY